MNEANQSVLTGIILIAIGVVIFVLLQVFSPQPETAPKTDIAPLVETIHLEKLSGPLNVVGEGVVRPRIRVSLSAQVSGEIIYKSSNLKPGGRFEKNEVLIRIDPRNYEAETNRIRGNIKASESQLKYVKQQVARLQNLSLKNVESESRLDEQIGKQGEMEGQLIALRAQLQRSLLDVERTEIRAPFDGAVFTEEVDVGNVIQPGQTLSQIYAEDTYEIIVALDDREASLIPELWNLDKKQEKIKAIVEAEYGNTSYRWKGFVDAVETGLDQTARTINAVVLVNKPRMAGQHTNKQDKLNSAPPLLPGMYTTVSIEGPSPKSSAIVPAKAIHGDNYIWWLNGNNELQIQQVRLLQAYENTLVIQSPILDSISELVTSNISTAVEGMPMRRLSETGSGEIR